jgi:hypothetical protein
MTQKKKKKRDKGTETQVDACGDINYNSNILKSTSVTS